MIRRTITCIALLLISCIFCQPVKAESLSMDLEKAKEIALMNNPSVKLARENLDKTQTQVTEARSGMFPSLSGFTSFQHAWELPTFILNLPPEMGGQQKFKMGTENNIAYGINLNQPLFTGGSIWNGYSISRKAREIATQQLKSTEQNILINVTSAYFGVLFARSTVQVSQDALKSAEKNLEQVNQFFNAGKASRFDVLRAEVQVANFKPTLVSAKNSYILAESQLRSILGLKQESELVFIDDLEFIDDPLLTAELDQLVEIALASRPEIYMINSQKDIAQYQLNLARASYMPSLFFSSNYQYQGMRDDLDFTGDDFYKSFNSTLSLSIPIFSGWKNSSKIQQARIGIKESNYQEESLVNGIQFEVKAAFYRMKETWENVLTQQKTIEQAKEALRLANLMYAEGASTQLDVLNANLALNQARMNHQKSLFDYNVALASIKKAINQL